MKLFSIGKVAKLLLSILLVFTSFNVLIGQRLLQPLKSLSLVANPVLLGRQSVIQDLEIVSVENPDTIIVNQTAQFSGYLKNTSTVTFEAEININFDVNQLEDIDFGNIENSLDEDADSYLQIPSVSLEPGDSVFFTKSFIIAPSEVDPNTTGVVIIWPEFRILQTADEEVVHNYSLEQFFASGLDLNGHCIGSGKFGNNNNASNKIKNITPNTLNNLQYYLAENNYNTAEVILTTIDGKVIMQQQQMPQLNTLHHLMVNDNSKMAFLTVVLQKPIAKPELVTIKLHNNTF